MNVHHLNNMYAFRIKHTADLLGIPDNALGDICHSEGTFKLPEYDFNVGWDDAPEWAQALTKRFEWKDLLEILRDINNWAARIRDNREKSREAEVYCFKDKLKKMHEEARAEATRTLWTHEKGTNLDFHVRLGADAHVDAESRRGGKTRAHVYIKYNWKTRVGAEFCVSKVSRKSVVNLDAEIIKNPVLSEQGVTVRKMYGWGPVAKPYISILERNKKIEIESLIEDNRTVSEAEALCSHFDDLIDRAKRNKPIHFHYYLLQHDTLLDSDGYELQATAYKYDQAVSNMNRLIRNEVIDSLLD